MKIVANREGLKAAIQAVLPAVPSQSPKPIMTNVLIEATESGTTVTGNNLEISIVRTVSDVTVQEPGAVVLPTAKLMQILNLSQDPDIVIETDDNSVHIKSVKGKWKLAREDDGLFPRAAAFDAKKYWICESAHLRVAIERTVFACDLDSTRYALGGVMFKVAEKTTLVATDGRRLALQPIENVTGHDDPEETSGSVVPVKGLKAAMRVLDNSNCHFYFTEKEFHLRTGDATLYARLLEGRFPRWEDVLPGSIAFTAIVKPKDFCNAVEMAGVTTSEESQGVEFDFSEPGKCKLQSKSENGSTVIDLPCEHDGKPIAITFAQRFLNEGASKMVGEIRIGLQSEKGAALLESDNGYKYVVMPLTKEA